jgi:hypothetical protein
MVIFAEGSQRRALAAALGPQAVPPIITMLFCFVMLTPPQVISLILSLSYKQAIVQINWFDVSFS